MNFPLDNKRSQEEEEEEEGERGEVAEDVYGRTESLIWDQALREHEGHEGGEGSHGEPSLVDEEEAKEGKSAPSSATIAAAEKSEEEVREPTVGPADHVLAEIPVEVRINLSFTVILPVELLCLTTFVIS